MKINIAQVLREEGASAFFELEEEFPSLSFGDEQLFFQTPVHVQLRVNNTNKLLLVQGTIHANIKAVCSRCLEEFSYPLEIKFEDEWVPRNQASEEQKETAILFDKDEVELTERVIEHIVLALPMKFICSPECRGLCSACGVNLNRNSCECKQEFIDPRLSALANWSSGD